MVTLAEFKIRRSLLLQVLRKFFNKSQNSRKLIQKMNVALRHELLELELLCRAFKVNRVIVSQCLVLGPSDIISEFHIEIIRKKPANLADFWALLEVSHWPTFKNWF